MSESTRKLLIVMLIALLSIELVSFFYNRQNAKPASPQISSEAVSSQQTVDYRKLSASEAKKMLDENPDVFLLDVRTEEEYQESHIKGAVLIPYDQLSDRAEAELPEKEAVILLYCRSGNRSKTAADTLLSMGYTNVYDFGGILSYPYETVSG
ncbi:rhodanese-like domain-containing protein [Oscillospiraceae bacterium MB08-C2-2]|nr:rhodanese-like domain-containing protein [Oscillospiraceae bacterium MB08-C2-2]